MPKRTVDRSRQFRNVQGGFRAVGNPDERTFAARICNYGVVDTYNTSWAPGVFADSLRTRLPAAVWSHDWDRPIGRVVDYQDRPDGLDVVVRMADFDAVPDAKMAYSLLRDEIFDQFSFAFVPEDGEDDPQHPGVLRFTRAQIDEVSPVLVGSVPGTRTLSVRSDESVGRAAAADLLLEFGTGAIDLSTALERLKAGSRTVATEADLPKASNGTPETNMKMTKVKHGYAPTNGDGSVCSVCGGQSDAAAHRARDAEDKRALGDMLNAMLGDNTVADTTEDDDLDPGTLAAGVDSCIDEAIELFAGLDTTELPAAVQQAIALIQAADVVVDQLMDALGVPDPDEDVQDGTLARNAPSTAPPAEPEPDPELDAAMARLDTLMGAN